MSVNSNIEWTDSTFNPWEGCQKVGPGCDNCYAEARNARFGGGAAPNWGPGAPRRRTSAANWQLPLRWERQAEAFKATHGRRQRVFCASLADVFDNAVDPQWRVDLFALIARTPSLDWLLLTKRIGNVAAMLGNYKTVPLLPNIWIGATIVNQEEADRDIPKLLAVPARVRFLSMEPLLGPVDLTNIPVGGGHGHHEFDPIITGNALQRVDAAAPHVHWVIVGGESGPHARPMHPQWARDIRDQCDAAGVPLLFKQWGEWLPCAGDDQRAHPDTIRERIENHTPAWPDGSVGHGHFKLNGGVGFPLLRVGKNAAGRLLDGVQHDGFPEAH